MHRPSLAGMLQAELMVYPTYDEKPMRMRWSALAPLVLLVSMVSDCTAESIPPPAAAAESRTLLERFSPCETRSLLSLDLSYGIDCEAPGFSKAGVPEYLTPGVAVSGIVGAKIAVDAGIVEGKGALVDENEMLLRRLRVFTLGKTSLFSGFNYKLEFAIEDGSFFLNDFYVQKSFEGYIKHIRLGHFDPPVSLEVLSSGSGRPFLETSLPVASFAPGFRPGLELFGHSKTLAWQLNLSTSGQDQNTGDSSEALLRLAGRIVWHQVPEEAVSSEQVLHLGLSSSYMLADADVVQYRSRPESFIAPYLVDTAEFSAGGAALVGAEFAWQRGPASIQAEIFENFVQADLPDEALRFHGAYIQTGVFLTGERRNYNRELGAFELVTPEHPVIERAGKGLETAGLSLGGWGAWETAARLSWVDLGSKSIRGGKMISFSTGLNWYWRSLTRVMFNYVYADVSESDESGAAHIAQLRLESYF